MDAIVVYGDGITRSCVIRNVSARGAIIELEPGVEVPSEFELRLESTGTQGICIVRHRTEGRIGVQFVSRALGQDLERVHQRLLAETELPVHGSVERATHAAPVYNPLSAPALRRNFLHNPSSGGEPVATGVCGSSPRASPSVSPDPPPLPIVSAASDQPAVKSVRKELLILPV